jgi:hypothetical protein
MEIKFEKTCNCSPEQYNAYICGHQVGYVRCRWGQVTVECPNVGGEMVYKALTEGYGFFTDDERDMHLNAARKAIELWNAKEQRRYKTTQQLLDSLDYTVDIIHALIYGCDVQDADLEKLADKLEAFYKKYEQKL